MIKAGVIGCGCQGLNYEWDYIGPYNSALYAKFHELIDDLGIDEGLTGASQGSETIWAWVILELGKELTCLLPCQNFGELWPSIDKEKLLNIERNSKKTLTLSTSGFSLKKEENRDRVLIQRSDIVIFVIDYNINRMDTAVKYAKELNKEIIIIEAKTLLA